MINPASLSAAWLLNIVKIQIIQVSVGYETRTYLNGPICYRFVITACETTVMTASNKKAVVIFAINVLSDNFFNKDEGNNAYSTLIEKYFVESGDETEANTDNEEGM